LVELIATEEKANFLV